ncbi:MAG: TetR/AcrR family transcriptional regulator [Fusobacteriaceae bacterium]
MNPKEKKNEIKKNEIKKNEIKKISTILFATKGIKNTTIRDIAKSLGIALGGIYYYYRSKEELFCEIVNDSIENRKGFLKTIEDSKGTFENKLKKIIARRLNLKKERYSLFLFSKIYENGEIHLTYDEYIKRDKLLEEFLEANEEELKSEYLGDINKISRLINSSLTKLLLILIESTEIKVVDEKSYNEMIEKYNELDIEREINIFYKMFFKEIVKKLPIR